MREYADPGDRQYRYAVGAQWIGAGRLWGGRSDHPVRLSGRYGTASDDAGDHSYVVVGCQSGAGDFRSLYFAAKRPVVYRDGNIIMVDDDRFPLKEGEVPELKSVRFRTLGCYPLTGGIESTATTLDEIIDETLSSVSSERTSRVIDNEAQGSMERRKREGYF